MSLNYLFVIPDYDSFISGGNHYNKNFIEALGNLGNVQTAPWEIFRLTKHSNTFIVIDSIYIDMLETDSILLNTNSILLLHYLDIFYDEKHNEPLKRKRLKQILAFKYIIVTGQFAFDWLQLTGVKKENIFLLTPMIQIQGSKMHRNPNPTWRILMVGNLLPVKGYLELLNELEIQKPAGIKITIIGDKNIDTEYAASIMQLIEEKPYLKKVCSIGETVPHETMGTYFEETDLMISASHFETFGMAIHEALSYGLPVMAIAGGNVANINHPLLDTFQSHQEIVSALANLKGFEKKPDTLTNRKFPENRSWAELANHFYSRTAGEKIK
jgi:hypothetical protein